MVKSRLKSIAEGFASLDARVGPLDNHRAADASGGKGRRELRIDRAAIMPPGGVFQIAVEAVMCDQAGMGGRAAPRAAGR